MNIFSGSFLAALDPARWSVVVTYVLAGTGLIGIVFLGLGIKSKNPPLRKFSITILGLCGLLFFLWTKTGAFRPLWIFLPLVLAGVFFFLWAKLKIAAILHGGAAFAARREGISRREIELIALAASVLAADWLAMQQRARQFMLVAVAGWIAAQFFAPDVGALGDKTDIAERAPLVFQDFWPDNVLHSENGYLTSSKFIPLRAIARRPNPNLYDKPDSENAGDVAGVMDAWAPYYVFANTEKSLLVATRPNAKENERLWALAQDCFCWTTRECLNIEQPTTIYRTLEDAQAQKNPLDEKYIYRFQDHFTPTDKTSTKRGFAMASLPIFANVEGKYFGFVRPEGTAGLYEMCWLPWDGSDGAVECRLRASRQEFESYIVGIRKLMIDWQNVEKKADSKKDLFASGQEHIMQVKRPQGSEVSLDTIKTRNQGIPRLDGYLQRPIEDELAYEDIKKKVLKMMELSNRLDLWSNDDVTFIKLSDMP